MLENRCGLIHGSKLYVEYFLYLKNQCKGKDHWRKSLKWFSASDFFWGWPAFISLDDLHDSSKGYLVDDTIILQLRIEKMILLKDVEESVKQE